MHQRTSQEKQEREIAERVRPVLRQQEERRDREEDGRD
jgi:hypothetical protein